MKKIVSRGEDVYSSDVFQILFEYEVSRCQRYPAPLALLQIEIAPTTLNEEILSTASAVFSSALNAHLRSVDIPSRSGNVFSVLLPTSDEHGARAVCERLISVFKNKIDVKDGNSIVFSLQIGASTHSGGPDISSDNISKKAAEALKQSKLKGPNTYILLS
jgi:GGDEF domain-containing protein